jgi:signal transduction histidine kinase/DNA-binding NarL/FixJ family response regulator
MARNSLASRLGLPLLGVILLATATIVILEHRQHAAQVERLAAASASALTSTLASGAVTSPAFAARLANSIGARRDILLVMILADHPPRVVASTLQRWVGAPLADVKDLPQGLRLQDLQPAKGLKSEPRSFLRGDTFAYADRVVLFSTDGEQETGWCLVVLDLKPLKEQTQEQYVTVVGLPLAIIIICGLLAGLLVNRQVIQPLNRLRTALQARPGNLRERCSIRSQDEIGALADALDAAEVQAERMRHKLEDALTAAQQATAAKSAFLANMSHEIRTPMNGVLGMTELLLGMGLNQEQEDATRTVYRSAKSLLGILNDILDFSKIEAGRLQLEDIPYDLHQVIYDTVDLFRGRVVSSTVELLARVAPGTPQRILGDPGRFRQVLNNLIGNAVKFTRQGHILIDVGGTQGRLQVEISDTGIGIPADRQSALFSPFTQADASTARQFGGTGLGLAICRKLVEAMGGSVTLASKVGTGTTFTIQLPLRVDPASPPLIAPAQDLAGKAILAVDDNPVNRRILEEQLRQLGCHVQMLESGAALLAALATRAWDGVVLDHHMPGISSEDLARSIRADARYAGVALVTLTSSGVRGEAKHMSDAGFNGYLVKPSPTEILGGVLASAMARVAQRDSTLVTAPAAQAPTLHRRILLAEDNPVNQKSQAGCYAGWSAR